ncbi:brassinosteroid LRR receptor kinase BRL2 [Selaginella moellendorffii]|uniref:brassinosteroid LRR receptor kinase BRL2 n=1 Tax=Selaginella moellendorffii TaxID=88036 RepID=UPI000D1D0194|nr:brassinosteroid LRR receptor kinase BRL2 [Selaginella moellendorffii]|eukprot:XP_024524786.1 brassinosteroid LRR receptor kinase BRL2 [Selaginella moellendorffii]
MAGNAWDSSTSSICEWEGVACSNQGRVVELHLRNLASFPSSLLASAIQGLPELKKLIISNTNFTGSVEDLSLQTCALNMLDLSGNRLEGGVPLQLLADCRGMKSLNLSNNMLTGPLPPSFFPLSCSLQHLDVSKNRLTGSVPRQIMNCSSLESISLDHNNFSEVFPSLSSSSNIRNLKLASNIFTALVIDSDGCRNLSELDISSNMLSEFKHPAICASLRVLNISNNNLSGSFTNLAKSLPSLQILDASFNRFSGRVPIIHSYLHYIDFSANNFRITPTRICASSQRAPSKLRTLMLPNNNLEGLVLSSVADCSSLELLDLSFNALTGEIPHNLCSKLPKLEHLLVWVNHLQGRIPSSLGSCSSLKILLLGHNNLYGDIPSDLTHLSKLWWLSLINNRLTGSIPRFSNGNLKLLQLSHNLLQGEIPKELDECDNLVDIELNSNALSGSISDRIGRQHSRVELLNVEDDDLVANLRFMLVDFNANDTTRVASWTSLIPNNSLTGGIPESLGDLSNLLYMDLSQNALQGIIPASLSHLNIGLFNVSHNNLSGSIPQTGKLTTFPASSYAGNPYLCGLPLITVQCSPNPNNLSSIAPNDDRREQQQHNAGDGDGLLPFSIAMGVISFITFGSTVFFWENRAIRSLEYVLLRAALI